MAADRSGPGSLGYLLADVLRLMRRDFFGRTAGMRLTPALARLLYYSHRDPGSHQAELAQRLEVTPVTLGRMVDRLVARGYLKRLPDPVDRRAFRVYVGRAGEPLVGRMNEVGKRTRARAVRGLSARDQATLARLLARIRANLSDDEH